MKSGVALRELNEPGRAPDGVRHVEGAEATTQLDLGRRVVARWLVFLGVAKRNPIAVRKWPTSKIFVINVFGSQFCTAMSGGYDPNLQCGRCTRSCTPDRTSPWARAVYGAIQHNRLVNSFLRITISMKRSQVSDFNGASSRPRLMLPRLAMI